jgi:hypothetical protein
VACGWSFLGRSLNPGSCWMVCVAGLGWGWSLPFDATTRCYLYNHILAV